MLDTGTQRYFKNVRRGSLKFALHIYVPFVVYTYTLAIILAFNMFVYIKCPQD